MLSGGVCAVKFSPRAANTHLEVNRNATGVTGTTHRAIEGLAFRWVTMGHLHNPQYRVGSRGHRFVISGGAGRMNGIVGRHWRTGSGWSEMLVPLQFSCLWTTHTFMSCLTLA